MPTWYSKAQSDTLLAGKAASSHNHAGVYAPVSHTHTASQVSDFDAAVGAKVDVATINNAFGQRAGAPIRPWEKAAPAGPELWTLANFQADGASYQTTSLTPSLTPNGTAQTKITQAKYADVIAGNEAFRLEFDYTMPSNGWAGISLKCVGGGGTVYGVEQWLVTVDSPETDGSGHIMFDFAPGLLSSDLFFELKLRTENNSNAGANLAVSNVTLRQIASDATRPLLVSKWYQAGGTYPMVYFQQRDVKTKVWKMAENHLGPDSTLTPYALSSITAFYDDAPFSSPIPDPAMRRTGTAVNGVQIGNQFISGAPGVQLRAGNNDQILTVWNGTTFEYRGNTHGGEVARGSGVLSIDRGSGFVPYTLRHMLEGARRFQITIPTEIRRTVDGTTPFCNVDHTLTYFPDGMIRCDRTTTFTQSTEVQNVFEWMSSHPMTVPFEGRLGRGLTVLGETDSHPTVAAPATPGSSTATTGGTLAAGTYSYRVTALSPYGESTGSVAKTQVTTGTTSTVILTWSAVTNATGYRVYGRTAGVEKLLGTTADLTFTDTGAAVPIGDLPVVNTARLYNGATVDTMAQSADATWAVYRDPRTGWCYGNIYDRDAALARTGVTAIHTRLMRGSGIQKNYANLVFGTGASYTVPSSTVWSATHWSFVYLPADPVNYHNEIAVRAASLGALKSIYPNT